MKRCRKTALAQANWWITITSQHDMLLQRPWASVPGSCLNSHLLHSVLSQQQNFRFAAVLTWNTAGFLSGCNGLYRLCLYIKHTPAWNTSLYNSFRSIVLYTYRCDIYYVKIILSSLKSKVICIVECFATI